MTDTDLIDIAIDCGALVKPHPWDKETTLVTFTIYELKEFIKILTSPPKSETAEDNGP